LQKEKELVNSRGIDWIRYDEANRTLDVAYASSGEYRYFDVGRDVYEWLSKVRSKGRFVNRLVKGKYRYERLDTDQQLLKEDDLERLLRGSLRSPCSPSKNENESP
jgi:hypothetical protein